MKKNSDTRIKKLRDKVTQAVVGLNRLQTFKIEFTGKRLVLGSKKWVDATREWIQSCPNFAETKGVFFGIRGLFQGQIRRQEPFMGLELQALKKLLSLMVSRADEAEWKFCHRLAFSSANYTSPGSEGRRLAIKKWEEFYRPRFIETTDPAVAWDARLFCSASAENRPETAEDVAQMAKWTEIVCDHDDWLRTH